MTIKDVTNKLKSQVGYHEKKSNKGLYTDTNNGSNNYTKYADLIKKTNLLNGNKQACAWCAVFLIANFYDMLGEDLTHKVLKLPKSSAGAGVAFLYSYMYTGVKVSPKEGDFIFFKATGANKPNHVGYVYKVDSKKVYTIEGNSGNAVKKHSYLLNSKKIYGYTRPCYDLIKNITMKEGKL